MFILGFCVRVAVFNALIGLAGGGERVAPLTPKVFISFEMDYILAKKKAITPTPHSAGLGVMVGSPHLWSSEGLVAMLNRIIIYLWYLHQRL